MIIPGNRCFIHIPKCGGTSVTQGLKHQYKINAVLRHSNHPFIIHHKKEGKDITDWHFTYDEAYVQFPDYRYITMIRHPIDRWVSIYKHFLMLGMIETDLEDWTIKALSTLPSLNFFDNHKFEYENSFKKFANFFKPQWMYYREPEVRVLRLEDDSIWVALDVMPQHLRKGVDIPEFDRDKIGSLIYTFYKKDFTRWHQFDR